MEQTEADLQCPLHTLSVMFPNVKIGDTALSYGIVRCTPQAFGCGKNKKLRNEIFIVPAYSVKCFQKSCSVFPVKTSY